jgi:hypothetical protein
MNPAIEAAFEFSNTDAVRYVDYWEQLTARTSSDLFRRFLFAFMSVHTTWESNVNGYQAIRDYKNWLGNRHGLRDRIAVVGAGLHNNRARYIDDFSESYWADPQWWRRAPRESWRVYRDRLEKKVVGLGPAKVSFALEIAYPLEAEVLCLDVHMLRLYGKRTQSLRAGEYERYEADWLGRCHAAEMPSFIVKQMHWDALQGRPDSRYWSHVFESH